MHHYTWWWWWGGPIGAAPSDVAEDTSPVPRPVRPAEPSQSIILIFQSVSPPTIAFMESPICLIAEAKCDDSFIDEAT